MFCPGPGRCPFGKAKGSGPASGARWGGVPPPAAPHLPITTQAPPPCAPKKRLPDEALFEGRNRFPCLLPACKRTPFFSFADIFLMYKRLRIRVHKKEPDKGPLLVRQ